MLVLPFDGEMPNVHATAFVAPGAVLIGRVTVGPAASIWFNAVLRGDGERITIGAGSNVQDGAVVHTDPGYPCEVGERVTIGHNAIVHGCRVGDGATIGMGATVLTGAQVGAQALIAAGALVREGDEIPERSLAAGVPAKIRRELSDAEMERFRAGTEGYIRRREVYLGMSRDTSA